MVGRGTGEEEGGEDSGGDSKKEEEGVSNNGMPEGIHLFSLGSDQAFLFRPFSPKHFLWEFVIWKLYYLFSRS